MEMGFNLSFIYNPLNGDRETEEAAENVDGL